MQRKLPNHSESFPCKSKKHINYETKYYKNKRMKKYRFNYLKLTKSIIPHT